MDSDDLFDYLVATDELDEFLGYDGSLDVEDEEINTDVELDDDVGKD